MKKLTPETLGSKLKNLREEVHMEQEVVARVLNIPRTAVHSIEHGKREVSTIELVEFCKLFRTSPNDLLDWHKYKTRNKND